MNAHETHRRASISASQAARSATVAITSPPLQFQGPGSPRSDRGGAGRSHTHVWRPPHPPFIAAHLAATSHPLASPRHRGRPSSEALSLRQKGNPCFSYASCIWNLNGLTPSLESNCLMSFAATSETFSRFPQPAHLRCLIASLRARLLGTRGLHRHIEASLPRPYLAR